MHKLLYYPDFEIQDENFLKFALLYIDEIRPIIPERAKGTLSNSMQSILTNTDLIKPYSPNYRDGYIASLEAINHLEAKANFATYGERSQKKKRATRKYTLFSDKYSYEFENYCLENSLGERCNEGILLDEDVALTYMSFLAEIISKETEIDMITDNVKYSDPVLRFPQRAKKVNRDRLDAIRWQIQFFVPVDLYKIPLAKFIELRSDSKFETARTKFVAELDAVLDTCDKDISQVDLNKIMQCKQEIYGLLKAIFLSCATVAVGVHSARNMRNAEKRSLDFWNNMGSVGVSLDTLRLHYAEIGEYLERIKEKKQARKYLARLRQLRPEIL